MAIQKSHLIRLVASFLFLFFFISCASTSESDLPLGVHRVYRLAAVQVSWIPDKNYTQLDQTFNLLRRSGANTIIFRTFHNYGDRFYGFAQPKAKAGVYFKTSKVPVVDDLLRIVADIAHRNGLKIFAWMTTRQAGFELEKEPQYRCRRYNFQRDVIEDSTGLSVFHPEVRNHILSVYKDLAQYPIDGILLQDDLILRHNEDFSEAAGAAYSMDTGRDLEPSRMYRRLIVDKDGQKRFNGYTEEFWTWTLWKARWISRLAGAVGDAVLREKPDLRIALNLMYETAAFPDKGLCWLSQSLPEAVSIGFDYYAIMAYHKQMEKELQKSPEEIMDIISRMAQSSVSLVSRPAQILMKFQTIEWSTGKPIPHGELYRVFRSSLSAGPISVALVPYGDHLDPVTLSKILGEVN